MHFSYSLLADVNAWQTACPIVQAVAAAANSGAPWPLERTHIGVSYSTTYPVNVSVPVSTLSTVAQGLNNVACQSLRYRRTLELATPPRVDNPRYAAG